MKKRMSMAFLLLAVLFLLNLSGFRNLFFQLRSLFAGTTILSLFSSLSSLIVTLMPLGLLVLLYFNTKQDLGKLSHIILLICGIGKLVSTALALRYQIPMLGGDFLLMLPTLISIALNILIGVLLIMGSDCVKKKQKKRAMVVLASIGIYIGIIPLALSILARGAYTMSFAQTLSPLLCLAAVSLLPVTLFDYDHCVFVNQKSISFLVVLAVVIGIVLLIAGGSSSSGGSGGSGSGSGGKNGFIGSDGKFHPYIEEFGDDVNQWMEDNW